MCRIRVSSDSKDVNDLTDNGSSNEAKLDTIATDGFQFHQNQLNFAVCATTGCGVGMKQHLQRIDLFIRSLHIYHFYYQVRRK